jgi:hypothetical protein
MSRQCPPGCQCGKHVHVLRTRYDKTCIECDQPFISKRSDTRFCSHSCYLQAYEREHGDERRATAARWQRANRERVREYRRQYDKEHAGHIRAVRAQKRAEVGADPEKAAERRAKAHEYYLANRDRIREKARQQREASRTWAFRSAHGVARSLLDDLWNAQNGKCYLCGDPLDPETHRAIHLDHDHRCCKLGRSCERCRRGLACKDCNLVIGHAQDDPARLRRIAAALESALADVDLRMQQPRQPRKHVSYEFTCQECGKSFKATRSDAMCCSAACYDRMRYRRTLEAKEAAAGPQTCEQCGQNFMAKRPARAKYCSKVCSNRAYVRRKQLLEHGGTAELLF